MWRDAPLFTIYIIILAALIGAAFASFINCMAGRSVKGQSGLKGRSHCPYCGQVLSARELIPIFSFVLQKGRCRHCGRPLSWRYLWTEIILALAFVAITLVYGLTIPTLAFLVVLCLLLAISLIDLDSGEIPDKLQLAIIAVFILYALFTPPILTMLGQGLLSAAVAAVPLLILVLAADKLLHRDTMGGGDIKLFFVLGLFLNWKLSILLLLLSCLVGLALAVLMKKKRGMEFPFGPAIAIAFVLVLLCGQPLVNWYIGLF